MLDSLHLMFHIASYHTCRHFVSCGQLQGKVANVYKEIKDIIRKPEYDTHLRNEKEFRYEKVDVLSLEERENDLSKTDCPIVIAGISLQLIIYSKSR